MRYLITIKDKLGPDFNTRESIDAGGFHDWVRQRKETIGLNFQTRLEQLRKYTERDVIDWEMGEQDNRDDLCEACGKEVANHETDAGILCDECFDQVYPKMNVNVERLIRANYKKGGFFQGKKFPLSLEEATLILTKSKRRTKVKNSILAVAVLFVVIPSNARAQSINNAPSVYDSSKGVTNVSSHQSINSDQTAGSSASILFHSQPTHPVETGSKNDSAWTGPNVIVSLEEAMKLAEAERLKTANNNISIAEAAKKAKEEAAKAKASNPSKTELVATQDSDGNVVYVRKVRKP